MSLLKQLIKIVTPNLSSAFDKYKVQTLKQKCTLEIPNVAEKKALGLLYEFYHFPSHFTNLQCYQNQIFNMFCAETLLDD
ncbi:hypothetical protein BpHYR1_012341 [Brachionus plicatilis]|uniref:Uncharacterized protein n=1 Tax=Brachionus plicatilis TaxID=10195 RepID=A0A3M7PUR9_BRAPC|nr:hypothetical protein BpHYR1_012341 [Brachionus plicatilis]